MMHQSQLEVKFDLGSCDCPAELVRPKLGQAKGNSKSEVLVVKTAETVLIPQVVTIVE